MVIWNAMSNESDSILPRLTTCKVLQLQLSAQLTWQSCPRKEQSRASPASMLKMCRRYVEDSRYLGYAAAISWAVGLLGCWIPLSARLHGRWVWHPRIVCCLNWDAASNLLAKIWSNAKNYYLFLEQFPEKVFPTEGLNRLPWVSLGHGCSDFWAWNLSIISVKRDNIPGVTVPKRSEMNSKVPWVGHIKHCKGDYFASSGTKWAATVPCLIWAWLARDPECAAISVSVFPWSLKEMIVLKMYPNIIGKQPSVWHDVLWLWIYLDIWLQQLAVALCIRGQCAPKFAHSSPENEQHPTSSRGCAKIKRRQITSRPQGARFHIQCITMLPGTQWHRNQEKITALAWTTTMSLQTSWSSISNSLCTWSIESPTSQKSRAKQSKTCQILVHLVHATKMDGQNGYLGFPNELAKRTAQGPRPCPNCLPSQITQRRPWKLRAVQFQPV